MKKISSNEYIGSPLVERITALKQAVLESDDPDLHIRLSEEVATFDGGLNEALDRYGFDRLTKEGVPEWFLLLDGTPEYHEIDAAARVIIIEAIEQFVDRFCQDNGLSI